MKKLIALLTVISLVTVLASCGKEEAPPVTEPESTVISEEVPATEAFNSDITAVTPSINTTDDTAVFVSESETVTELHHHHDIALLDELLHDIQCQHGLAAAGGCHHDAVAGRYAFFLRVPDILFQRYLINTVIEIHPFLIRGECRVVDEQTEREGKRGQEQEIAVEPFLLSGNRS